MNAADLHAASVYAGVVRYLTDNGWRREEKESGWWAKEGEDERMLGEALSRQLDIEGLDQREMFSWEPEEFWGR